MTLCQNPQSAKGILSQSRTLQSLSRTGFVTPLAPFENCSKAQNVSDGFVKPVAPICGMWAYLASNHPGSRLSSSGLARSSSTIHECRFFR